MYWQITYSDFFLRLASPNILFYYPISIGQHLGFVVKLNYNL
jgi:hypothetical protein